MAFSADPADKMLRIQGTGEIRREVSLLGRSGSPTRPFAEEVKMLLRSASLRLVLHASRCRQRSTVPLSMASAASRGEARSPRRAPKPLPNALSREARNAFAAAGAWHTSFVILCVVPNASASSDFV